MLTDMVMPEMSGEALFGALRQISPKVRVLMMSGYSLQYDLGELRGRGIKGFVQKPFDMNALSRAVRQAIDEQG